MAFKNITHPNLETTQTELFICPVNKQVLAVGLIVSNTTTNDITVTFKLNTTHIVKNCIVKPNSTLILSGDEHKIVLMGNDILYGSCNTLNAADVIFSYMEIDN